jgi:hypothetical protein
VLDAQHGMRAEILHCGDRSELLALTIPHRETDQVGPIHFVVPWSGQRASRYADVAAGVHGRGFAIVEARNAGDQRVAVRPSLLEDVTPPFTALAAGTQPPLLVRQQRVVVRGRRDDLEPSLHTIRGDDAPHHDDRGCAQLAWGRRLRGLRGAVALHEAGDGVGELRSALLPVADAVERTGEGLPSFSVAIGL